MGKFMSSCAGTHRGARSRLEYLTGDDEMIDLDHYNAPGKTALMAEFRRRDDLGLPELTEAEAASISKEANRVHTFGAGYKTDRNGEPIQQGIGSLGHETVNHYGGIRKYEGEDAYWRAVRAAYARDRAHAQSLGLPEPSRVGS
jgi:hypothetical protein